VIIVIDQSSGMPEEEEEYGFSSAIALHVQE